MDFNSEIIIGDAKLKANSTSLYFSGNFDICVFETRIKIIDGYLHHYHEKGRTFIYKKPLYEFSNDAFITQIDNIEFSFKRQ